MSDTATLERPAKKVTPAPASGFIDMPASVLQKIIRVSAPAASTDSYRPILTGAHVEFYGGNQLTVTTTDSYRLYRQQVGIETADSQGAFDVLIPADWLSRWARNRFTKRAMVTLTVADGRCTLTTGDETTSVKLIDAEYPNTAALLDRTQDGKEPDTTVGFNPTYLGGVFKAALAFTGHSAVEVTHLDPLKTCRFKVQRGSDVLDMILMPVRMPVRISG